MKLLRELKKHEASVFVFTGDGSREATILCPICERYNGKTRFIWFPESPIKRGLKQTGLSALNVVPHAVAKYELRRSLFLLDREHLERGVEESIQVRSYLHELGARAETTSVLLPGKSFVLGGAVSGQPFELCAVILGTTLRIEDELSELVQAVYGVRIAPDKPEIRRFLRSKGKDVKGIVRAASLDQLEGSFPGLCSALKWIEGAGHESSMR